MNDAGSGDNILKYNSKTSQILVTVFKFNSISKLQIKAALNEKEKSSADKKTYNTFKFVYCTPHIKIYAAETLQLFVVVVCS